MDDNLNPVMADPRGARAVVARQPILDPQWDVIGFELLYRSLDGLRPASPEAATATVLASSMSAIGWPALVGDRPAYVNVTRRFLLEMESLPLPPERVILELVEDQLVDAALVEAARAAATKGFALALDDFRYHPDLEPLLEIATVVKLDVQALGRWKLIDEFQRLEARDLLLLAEKVETAEEYELCRDLGFDAYQGFFFARPELVRGRAVPTRSLDTLGRLAGAASFEELEATIRRDAGLSHQLLRFINSAFVSPRHTIASLRQAMMLVGTVAIRRWATLISLAGLRDCPDVLLSTALVRARTAELVARERSAADADRAFTVGLFSLLDVLTGTPMVELLTQLPLDRRTTQALIEHEGPEGHLLRAVTAYERGDFAAAGDLDLAALSGAYVDAVRWERELALTSR